MAKTRVRPGIGIDIGGTGIKGAVVDLEAGELLGKRRKISTPEGGSPADILAAVVELTGTLRDDAAKIAGGAEEALALPFGIALASIVKHGTTLTAANISPEWIGLDAAAMFERELGHRVALANDADAAGVGELHYGAAKGRLDSVLMTTLGTGIGTALFHNGHLFPNTELGHIEIDGHPDYEKFAASKVREKQGLSWTDWASRLTPFYRTLERLLAPDLFVVSGGISKQGDEFVHLIDVQTPVVVAHLRNNAGIVGAARLAADGWV